MLFNGICDFIMFTKMEWRPAIWIPEGLGNTYKSKYGAFPIRK